MRLYQSVVDTWPESNYAKRSRILIISADINLGDDPNALAGVDELIAKFHGKPVLCKVVFQTGEEYYDKASQMKNKGLKPESEDCFQKAVSLPLPSPLSKSLKILQISQKYDWGRTHI
jgi:hypothetical protein